ncbi:hypothetical protein D3C85_1475760 [compost metagenome]
MCSEWSLRDSEEGNPLSGRGAEFALAAVPYGKSLERCLEFHCDSANPLLPDPAAEELDVSSAAADAGG